MRLVHERSTETLRLGPCDRARADVPIARARSRRIANRKASSGQPGGGGCSWNNLTRLGGRGSFPRWSRAPDATRMPLKPGPRGGRPHRLRGVSRALTSSTCNGRQRGRRINRSAAAISRVAAATSFGVCSAPWRGKGVVVPISAAIVTVSRVTADALLSGTAAGIGGGLGAHGAARATGSAGLFHPTVMERLATGSYPGGRLIDIPSQSNPESGPVSNPE